jgi:hypothetical protein
MLFPPSDTYRNQEARVHGAQAEGGGGGVSVDAGGGNGGGGGGGRAGAGCCGGYGASKGVDPNGGKDVDPLGKGVEPLGKGFGPLGKGGSKAVDPFADLVDPFADLERLFLAAPSPSSVPAVFSRGVPPQAGRGGGGGGGGGRGSLSAAMTELDTLFGPAPPLQDD